MADLSLNNISTISLVQAPPLLENGNVNNVLILTTSRHQDNAQFSRHIDSSSVASAYGSNSIVRQMASNIFAQSPNILTGGGQLIVANVENVTPATSGSFLTVDLSSNLSALQAITDGSLTIVTGTSRHNIFNLDFSSATSVVDIARILQSRTPNSIIEAVGDRIRITAKEVGSQSGISLESAVTGTDITTSSLLNVAGGTETAGTDYQGDTIQDEITRVQGLVDFRAVMVDFNIDSITLRALETAIANERILFFHQFSSTRDLGGSISESRQAGRTRFRSLLYSTNLAEANLFKAAYVGRALSVNFNAGNTSTTMHLKPLNNVNIDGGITQSILESARDVGADIYTSFAGQGLVYTSGANGFFDDVYNDIWLANEIQLVGINTLARTNTKIPQTERGLVILTDSYRRLLERAVLVGVIAPGTWTGADTFGNEADFRRNIRETGFFIYHEPISLQSQEDREARRTPTYRIAVKRAGAVHSINLIINIEA